MAMIAGGCKKTVETTPLESASTIVDIKEGKGTMFSLDNGVKVKVRGDKVSAYSPEGVKVFSRLDRNIAFLWSCACVGQKVVFKADKCMLIPALTYYYQKADGKITYCYNEARKAWVRPQSKTFDCATPLLKILFILFQCILLISVVFCGIAFNKATGTWKRDTSNFFAIFHYNYLSLSWEKPLWESIYNISIIAGGISGTLSFFFWIFDPYRNTWFDGFFALWVGFSLFVMEIMLIITAVLIIVAIIAQFATDEKSGSIL